MSLSSTYTVDFSYKTQSRVKSVDLHPTEPWILSSLFDGIVMIHNYNTGVWVGNVLILGFSETV